MSRPEAHWIALLPQLARVASRARTAAERRAHPWVSEATVAHAEALVASLRTDALTQLPPPEARTAEAMAAAAAALGVGRAMLYRLVGAGGLLVPDPDPAPAPSPAKGARRAR